MLGSAKTNLPLLTWTSVCESIQPRFDRFLMAHQIWDIKGAARRMQKSSFYENWSGGRTAAAAAG